jgi:hypothetical protein
VFVMTERYCWKTLIENPTKTPEHMSRQTPRMFKKGKHYKLYPYDSRSCNRNAKAGRQLWWFQIAGAGEGGFNPPPARAWACRFAQSRG